MEQISLIKRNIEHFYNQASEETRLNKGMGVFEFERVKVLIEKHISTSNLKIIDVGGGTGKYSEWLAKKGHEVHLVEPVLKHLQLAEKRAKKLKNKFTVHQGEARQLRFSNNFADLVILHGPLYHLQQKEDREQAINEAKRVLKNNGIILGFAINYTASTLAGLLNGLVHRKTFFEMCIEELLEGTHNPPNDFPWLLAEAYYHNPEQLKAEFLDKDLTYLNTYAVEGMIWLDSHFFSNMENEKKRKRLLELLKITENKDNLLAFSPHIMIAVKKQKTYEK